MNEETTRIGRDELNLTQFPLAVLRRAAKGQNCVEFRDGDRTWKLTGHPDKGLPTTEDVNVYVCLMELAKEQGFERQTVFTRHDLIQRLGWADYGDSYQRLEDSLARWVRVLITAEHCYFDKANREKVGRREFYLIQSYVLPQIGKDVPRGGITGPGEGNAWIVWGEEVYRNIQAGYLKRLDVGFYLSLKSAVSQALFRYLDARRLDGKTQFRQDLRELACERLGLSRNMDRAQLRRELERAHRELIGKGFLASADVVKDGRVVMLVYTFGKVAVPELVDPETEARTKKMLEDYERWKSRKSGRSAPKAGEPILAVEGLAGRAKRERPQKSRGVGGSSGFTSVSEVAGAGEQGSRGAEES